MRATISGLLVAAIAAVPSGAVRADGLEAEYGAAGPYAGQPAYMAAERPPQESYQPPPDNVCYDEEHQAYDCSADPDYATYGQVDDGYSPQAYQDFEQTLAPYGSWVDDPNYGRVWTPSAEAVGADFTPYYNGGSWSLTDYGWTWVSSYEWGWAPFHYGRWLTLPGRGWSWVPGRVWGPAWVHWRYGGGYVGWTALPPRGVRVAPPYGMRAGQWSFVATPMLGEAHLNRVAPSVVSAVYPRTTAGNVLRAVGSSRVNIGPPAVALSLGYLRPVPLRGIPAVLPRAQVTVAAGVPMAARPYVVAGRPAPGWGTARNGGSIPIGGPRPGYQPAYRGTLTAPVYRGPAAPLYHVPAPAAPAAPVHSAPAAGGGGGGHSVSRGGGHH